MQMVRSEAYSSCRTSLETPITLPGRRQNSYWRKLTIALLLDIDSGR
jgi:hypothetical protein